MRRSVLPGRRCLLPTAAARLQSGRNDANPGSDTRSDNGSGTGAGICHVASPGALNPGFDPGIDPVMSAYLSLTRGPGARPAWAVDPSVVGVGVGLRRTAGSYGTQRCLKIFVRAKRPRRDLRNPAPGHICLPDDGDTVEIDVETLPMLHPRGAAGPAVPRGGPNAVRASRGGAPWGSYGCLLRGRSEDHVYLLGCGHVLAAGSGSKRGDRLLVPDNNAGVHDAARLADWIVPTPSPWGFPNSVDAAIAEIDHPDAIARLADLLPTGISDDIRSGMSLHCLGAATGRQSTTVVCERASLAIATRTADGRLLRLGFRDQVLCRDDTSAGDSGACIVDDRGRAVGMHVFGSDATAGARLSRDLASSDGQGAVSVFTPLHAVIDAFAPERGLQLVDDATPAAIAAEPPPVDDPTDAVDVVARTIFGEARNGPAEIRHAIAEVIYNRAAQRSPRFGMSVEAVCRMPGQFSCWNPGDPHRARTLTIALDDPAIGDCVAIARDLLAGRVGTLTRGADHYHHHRVYPTYSRERTPCARIGNYVFFNDIP